MTILDFTAARQAKTGQPAPQPRFALGDRVVPTAHPDAPYSVIVAARPDPAHRYRYQTMLGGKVSRMFAEDDLAHYDPPAPGAA